jgi:hypothetical protein
MHKTFSTGCSRIPPIRSHKTKILLSANYIARISRVSRSDYMLEFLVVNVFGEIWTIAIVKLARIKKLEKNFRLSIRRIRVRIPIQKIKISYPRACIIRTVSK